MKRANDPRVTFVMHTVDRLLSIRDGEMIGQILYHGTDFALRSWTRPRVRAVFAAILENTPEVELDRLVEAAVEAMKDSRETTASYAAEAAAAQVEQSGGVQ